MPVICALDYQVGNFSQWSGVQEKAPGRAQVLASPLPNDTRKWAEFSVHPGDYLGTTTLPERCEVLDTRFPPSMREGDNYWFAWSTRFDPAYAPHVFNNAIGDAWHSFTDLHAVGSAGYNPGFAIRTNPGPPITYTIYWEAQQVGGAPGQDPGGIAPKADLFANVVLGNEYEILWNVLASSSKTIGYQEIWINGQIVMPKRQVATLYNNNTVYLKQGFYREASPTIDNIWHTGTRVATDYASAVAGFVSNNWTTSAHKTVTLTDDA